MKIVLIGAGNLATNLGKALLSAGHDILQVYSRTSEAASTLATAVGGAPTTDINSVNPNADIYILSVKDSVLAEIIPTLCKGKEKKLFVHTAGSMPMDIFKGMALHYGVLYPMQTFSMERELDFSKIPVFVEGNDELALQTATELAHSVSQMVYELNSEDRKHLHLAAVFASNFVNHCYALSADILEKHGLDFSVMLPLIDEVADKVHQLSPKDAQTGPALRYDENVIRSQSQLLRTNPIVKEIYDRMSLSIHNMSKK